MYLMTNPEEKFFAVVFFFSAKNVPQFKKSIPIKKENSNPSSINSVDQYFSL